MATDVEKLEAIKLTRFTLPGFGLPLDFAPKAAWKEFKGEIDQTNFKPRELIRHPKLGEGVQLFPNALDEVMLDSTGEITGRPVMNLTTRREFTMLQIMNEITDKAGWEIKVFDEDISNKWKLEMVSTENRDVSQKMADYIIAELRYKAKIFKKIGAVQIYSGDVVKSDSAVPTSLKLALREAIKPLEEVPERFKDYHPGSDNKVVDLVHPSLFPLVYGRSRILSDQLVRLENAVQSTGLGETVPVPYETVKNEEPRQYWNRPASRIPYSTKFQWLPCEVELEPNDDAVKITSYINNLHPQKHANIYTVIEQFIAKAIPLWSMTLTPLKDGQYAGELRIDYTEVHYDPDPENDESITEGRPREEDFPDEDEYSERLYEWYERTRVVVQPEPEDFLDEEESDEESEDAEKMQEDTPGDTAEKIITSKESHDDVDLRRDYSHRGLQVIVKLANIELTPDKPTYEGGSWHVEGQKNEHIVATALYYYDTENISASRLAFRQQSDPETLDIDYEQNNHDWLPAVFGCQNEEVAVQEIGSVLCTEGRLITFPNILQHRVAPFELEDKTKPGHRKILALFLVDPRIRIISTANVPCQQKEWWSEEVESAGALEKLPQELRDKVFKGVDDFPISLEEAKVLREELMEERKVFRGHQREVFEQQTFSLCEH